MLEGDYYLVNFETVVTHAIARHGHVLSESEHEVIERYRSLSRAARMLYVRLFLRTGPVFRLSRLAYAEIGSCEAAFDEIERAGLGMSIRAKDAESAALCMATLTVPELQEIARGAKVNVSGRKSDVVELLASNRSARAALKRTDRFVALAVRAPFDHCRVLFFGNRWQELTEFVLVDLQLLRYPTYEISAATPLFPDRTEFDRYLASAEASEIDLGQLDDETLIATAERSARQFQESTPLPSFRRRVDPTRYLGTLAIAAARELERRGYIDLASSTYENVSLAEHDADTRVEAAVRLGILGKRGGDVSLFDAASARLLEHESVDQIARYALEERRHKLQLGESPEGRLLSPATFDLTFEAAGHEGSKALYRSADGSAVTVEEVVLQSFASGGLYAENALYSTLFGLLFWDQIFAPVPGAFLHPFQSAPLDASTSEFFECRKTMLVERLDEISRSDVGDLVGRAYRQYQGTASMFARWELYTETDLSTASISLGNTLVPILDRIARHPGRHAKGMPDLLVWDEGRPVAVEVKGPGDQVRLEQRLWHDVMLRAGLEVRIARVQRKPKR
jgi:hypothetical protein